MSLVTSLSTRTQKPSQRRTHLPLSLLSGSLSRLPSSISPLSSTRTFACSHLRQTHAAAPAHALPLHTAWPPPSSPGTPLPSSLPPAHTSHPLLPPSLLLPLLPRRPLPCLSILLLLPETIYLPQTPNRSSPLSKSSCLNELPSLALLQLFPFKLQASGAPAPSLRHRSRGVWLGPNSSEPLF
ncbi:hypothetical protein AAC387_Pa09g1325 [Persea americana]